jgi:serine/threonine protein kinase/tetratricopeptide (TPR) repeat protein
MSLLPDSSAPRSERFEILSRLGAGGMGVVYLALDRKRNVRVALKALPKLDADPLLSFKQEFRALQDVQHPNLVGLGELFEEEGRWFFTLELIEGIDLLSYVRPDENSELYGQTIAQDRMMTVRHTAVTLTDLTRADPDHHSGPEQPASAVFDEGRIRSAFAQLADALLALHAAGKVHRDIKPANVLVTQEGRVVVLDFGLVLDFMDAKNDTRDPSGTLVYMAPEQAETTAVGPSADWYSFGVVLYQALTGRLPFRGSAPQVLLAKMRSSPQRPRELCPEIPRDLDELCAKLIVPDPHQRPSGEQILRTLVEGDTVELPLTRSASRANRPAHAEFVGRTTELQTMSWTLAGTRQTGAAAIAVIGESGLGKSALARRFIELAAESQGALVFSGRCYAREMIRYKAFDGIVDALANHLRRLSKDVKQLLPDGIATLAQVFPVLKRVKAIAEISPVVLDPGQLRAQAFGVFRALLQKLAADRPVILYVDDLQWADGDSFALLSSILKAPEPPRIMFLATMRPGGEALLEQVTVAKRIMLAPLPIEDGEELARRLLAETRPGANDGARTLASDAAGHPLFIQELVRAMVELGTESVGKLDDVMKARIDHLDSDARLLFDLVCVAGAPIAEDVLARASGSDAATFDRTLASLRTRSFVRLSSARGERTLEPYHDRVREAGTAVLSEKSTVERHKNIALALEDLGRVDPERLAVHWRGAGDLEKALQYTAQAAQVAMGALAFHHAAGLFSEALKLDETLRQQGRSGVDVVTRARWLRQLGEARLGLGDLIESVKSLNQALTILDEELPVPIPVKEVRKIFKAELRRMRNPQPVPPPATREEFDHALEGVRIRVRLTQIHYYRNEMALAVTTCLRSMIRAEPLGPSPELIRAYAQNCVAASLQPLHRLAEMYAERAMSLSQVVDDPAARSTALLCVGIYGNGTGRWQHAVPGLATAIEINEKLGDRREWGKNMHALGYTELLRGEPEAAARRFEKLYLASGRAGDVQQQVWGLAGQAASLLRMGDAAAAQGVASQALVLLGEGPDRTSEIIVRGVMAAANAKTHEFNAAASAAAVCLERIGSIPATVYSTSVGYVGLADAYLALWRAGAPGAEEGARRAIDLLRRHARVFPIGMSAAYRSLGMVAALTGSPERAHARFERSVAAARALGMQGELKHAEDALRLFQTG